MWTSLLNAALYAKGDVHLTENGPIEPPGVNRSQTGSGPLYRLYETADGWVQIAAVRADDWGPFCTTLGVSELVDDRRFATPEDRFTRRSELEALLEPAFLKRTALQWRRAFDAAGVPAEVSVDTSDGESVLFDEENIRLGLVADLHHATAGRLRQAGQLMRFSDTPAVVQRAAPVRGEHTLQIVRWLGYDEPTINDYTARGVIGAA